MQKIFLSLTISLLLLLNSLLNVSAAEPLKSQIEFKEKRSIHLKLLPETIIDTELTLPGDFFSAFLTKQSADILRVPLGSRLIGQITENIDSGSFNRDAKLKAHVTKLMLPDGSVVKVSADLSSTGDIAAEFDANADFKNFVKKVSKESTEIGASALVGAIDSVQIAGLGTAISTSGISTAIGAGIGLAMGLGHSLTKTGESIHSSGFLPLNFRLESEFRLLETMPLIYQNLDPVASSLLGLDIKILSMQKNYSKNFGDFILVDLQITNSSDKKIFLGDFVISSNSHIVPVLANPLLTNSYNDFIEAHSQSHSKIAFALVQYLKKDNYQLMLLDPISDTIIADTELDFTSYL